MEIRIRAVEFAGSVCRTRIPFRFGRVTLVEAPVLIARVTIASDAGEAQGLAGDLCVPKWFEKDPDKSAGDDLRALFASAERAASAFDGAGGSGFEVWHAAHRVCTRGALASGVPLVDGFGVALVERAMIDATARAAGISFADALARDLFGFDAGALLPALAGAGRFDADAIARPERVWVRHTVGGLDPLRSEDVPPELRGDDDHPVALEEDIRRFGLRAFKLKAGGDPPSDVARLAAIARVIESCGVVEPIYTLDANESYEGIADVHALLDGLEADPDTRGLRAGLAYLEQPLPRTRTHDPATRDDVRALAKRVPLLIDEADDDVDAFARALELGYRGVSVKNCKGVFRALANHRLCAAHGEGAFQTSEDLTNLPVLPLQQDLATVAALGLPHSERNGHHFFPGLDVVPRVEAEAALHAQPDLYVRRGGRIVLDVRDGALSLACQDAVGYGVASAIDFDGRTPIEALARALPR